MGNSLEYKQYLEKYLQVSGVKTRVEGSKTFYQCPNPYHADEKPSAVLYDNNGRQKLTCMSSCGESWDVLDVIMLRTGKKEFIEQIEELERTIGIDLSEFKPQKPKYEALPIEDARKKFTKNLFLSRAKKMNPCPGDIITDSWPFYDKSGKNILMIDVRFEFENSENNDKNVVSFYYNGKNVVSKDSPVLVYGLEKLSQDKSRLIVEGCKTARAGEQLENFTTHTWNRGTANIKKADWSIFGKGENCFYLPDDDQKRYPDNLMMQQKGIAGKLKTPREQPGIKAALEIKKILPEIKIISPMLKAREIKDDGADLFEYLQVYTPENIESHILNSPELEIPPDEPLTPNSSIVEDSDSGETFLHDEQEFPFVPLGVADDGYKYYLDQANRIQKIKKVNKGDLYDLADLSFWEKEFGNKGKISWDEAVNFTTQICIYKDFDPLSLRGRGAWKNGKGDILFYDGDKLHGGTDPDHTYLRKKSIYKKMGLFEKPASFEICQQIAEIVSRMTFETKLDTVRALSWATLAPFAGALPWRPALLLTGRSGTGKTTILDNVLKKLCGHYLYLNGGATPAGARGLNSNDSTAIFLEELEGDTEKGALNRMEFFKMMRQSASESSPPDVKGTKDGGYIAYNMTNMFLFLGIDPTIQHEADSKRIFTVNLVEPEDKNNWYEIEKQINDILTVENCKAVRALTWQKLPEILDTAKKIINIIKEVTGKKQRSSFAEAMLISTYLLIWRGMPTYDQWDENQQTEAAFKIGEIFCDYEHEETNEVHDMLNMILDTSVNIMETRETKTLRMILFAIKNYDSEGHEKEYKETLERFGLKLNKDGNLAIEKNNNSEIIRIVRRGKDYAKFLMRHDSLIKKSEPTWMSGKTRQCMIFEGDFIEKKPVEETEKIDFE